MSTIATLTQFTAATRAKAAEVNANFTAITDAVNGFGLFTDVNRTITANLTFTPAAGVGLTVSTGGIAVTGTVTLGTAASKIVPGATSLSLRNNADSADNLIILDSGAATFRAGTTVTVTTLAATSIGGTLTTAAQANVTSLGTLTALTIAGNLTFSGSARKILPDASAGLTIRNAGDTLDLLGCGIASTGTGNIRIGAASVATTATTGFPIMTAVSGGAPTGIVPEGSYALDATNNKLWISYGSGTWKYVALS